jgi:hypothetical protein
MPILKEQQNPSLGCTVDDLLLTIQHQVRQVRTENPELADSHLDDVTLRVFNGALLAQFVFRE